MKNLLTWLKHPLHLAASLGALLPVYMVALYMQTYGRNVPTNDHWLFGIKIATAAKNGTLSLDVILQDFAGHRIFFTGALHAIMARYSDWNTVYEMYVNLPLAFGEWLVSLLILRKVYPHLVAALMIPFSLLIFAVYQYWNWLSGFYSIWHFVPLFFLLSVLVLQQLKQGWQAVGLAIFFAFCATFSLGPGVVVWVTVLLSMVLFGYRKPQFYAAVLLAFGLTIFVYTREVQVDVGGESGGFSSLRFAPPDEMATFFFTFLGNPFTAEYDHVIASRLALLGMALLGGNLAYLWGQKHSLQQLAPWLLWAAFAVGVALLITITRYVEFRWITALEQRYTAISTYFWLAYLVTAAAVMWGIYQQNSYRWQVLLLLLNAGLLLAMGAYYLRANLWNWQATAQRYNGEKIALPYDDFDAEDCLLQYPLTRDGVCVWETFVNQLGNAHAEQIYQVAAYRMTIFASQEAANVLPPTYRANDPIIIQSPSRWLNVYIRDWMLLGLPDSSLYHLAPPEELVFTGELPRPLGPHVYADFAEFADALQNADQIWHISTSETAEAAEALEAEMLQQGYIPLYIPIRVAPYAEGDFKILRYRRAPAQTETLFRFGDELSLQAVEVRGEIEACAELQVESWWLAEETPAANYSATLVLQNAAGEKLANSDGSPAGIETGVWVAGLLYSDDRSLRLPCDLPEGDYQLLWGLYEAYTLEELPVYDAEGVEIGTRAPIK